MNFIHATLDRIEGSYAVLILEDGQTLNWPVNKLPLGYKEGMVCRLQLEYDGKEELKQENIAKQILNEILNTTKQAQPNVRSEKSQS